MQANKGRGLFITGTDTGCGKTSVTVALTKALQERGRRVWPVKPVASGGIWTGREFLSEDTRLLAEAAELAPEKVTFWTFAEPAAPPIAARHAGVVLDLALIANRVREQFQPNTLTLVEGVGGLLCPLTETETIADLATLLGLPLLVVARRSLGTLNHTLLTLEVARQRGLRVVGLVVSETEPVEGLAQRTCLEALRQRILVPLLARLPNATSPGVSRLIDCDDVDWWNLAGELLPCKP